MNGHNWGDSRPTASLVALRPVERSSPSLLFGLNRELRALALAERGAVDGGGGGCFSASLGFARLTQVDQLGHNYPRTTLAMASRRPFTKPASRLS